GLPGKTRQRLLVKLGEFEEKLAIVNGEQSFAVPLQAGLNHVILRPLERVTTFLPTDPRQLLIHMTGISASTPHEEEAAQIQKIENPNGLESRSGKEQFFWINGA